MSDDKTLPTPTPDAFASLSKFKVKPLESDTPEPRALKQAIDQVAESNGFRSREAAAPKKDRFNSAGPKKQLNIRIDVDVHEDFYAEAEKRGIRVLGDLLKLALEALKEKG